MMYFNPDEFIDYLVDMFIISKDCLQHFEHIDRTSETLTLIVDNYVAGLVQRVRDVENHQEAIDNVVNKILGFTPGTFTHGKVIDDGFNKFEFAADRKRLSNTTNNDSPDRFIGRHIAPDLGQLGVRLRGHGIVTVGSIDAYAQYMLGWVVEH